MSWGSLGVNRGSGGPWVLPWGALRVNRASWGSLGAALGVPGCFHGVLGVPGCCPGGPWVFPGCPGGPWVLLWGSLGINRGSGGPWVLTGHPGGPWVLPWGSLGVSRGSWGSLGAALGGVKGCPGCRHGSGVRGLCQCDRGQRGEGDQEDCGREMGEVGREGHDGGWGSPGDHGRAARALLTFRSLCTMNFWWQYCTADTICKRREGGSSQGRPHPRMGITWWVRVGGGGSHTASPPVGTWPGPPSPSCAREPPGSQRLHLGESAGVRCSHGPPHPPPLAYSITR